MLGELRAANTSPLFLLFRKGSTPDPAQTWGRDIVRLISSPRFSANAVAVAALSFDEITM